MNYDSLERYYLMLEHTILNNNSATATMFHRFFSQFQKEDPKHFNAGGGSTTRDCNQPDERNCPQGPGEKETSHLKKKLHESHEIIRILTLENSNLVKALRNERKKSGLQLSESEEEKCTKQSEKTNKKYKRRFPSLNSHSTFEDCKKENFRLQAEIKDKADRIHNICVLFMRLKSNKDVVKQKLEYLEAEFNETTMDLIEKLAATRDEINCITDARYHTMKDYRNANTIRAVQKNGQLSLENSMLRLQATRLKQRIFDLENEITFVEVNTRKREVRTVPSRTSFSSCSLSNQRHNHYENSGKTACKSAEAVRPHKQDSEGNHQCQSCHKRKPTGSSKSAEFNYLPGPFKQDQYYISKRSATCNKNRDIWCGGDAQSLEKCESNYNYVAKPNQRSVYCHHHDAATFFEMNSKESLVLQATPVQPDHNMKLHNNSQYTKATKKTRGIEVTSLRNTCENECSKNNVLEQYSEESLLSDQCNCHSLIDISPELCSKSSSESPFEETGSRNKFKNNCLISPVPRNSSEESVLSEPCNLRGSKSAPKILERTEYQAEA